MRIPSSDPRAATIRASTGHGADTAPWTNDAAHADAVRRSGARLIDAWQTAMVAGDVGEVDRLVRRSRAVTDAQRLLSPHERLLG